MLFWERGWGGGVIICYAACLWGQLTNTPTSEPGGGAGQLCCLPVRGPAACFWFSYTTSYRHRDWMTRIFQNRLSVKSSDKHASVPEGAKSYPSAAKCRGHVPDGFRSRPQILALAKARSQVFLEAVVAPTGADHQRDTGHRLSTHPCDASSPGSHPSPAPPRQAGGRGDVILEA